VLASVEVVLRLGESDSPYDMSVVDGIATGVVPALSEANALLTMLPVIVVSASADVVRAVLKFLVPQPHESPAGAVFDDASR
jgi:hypothetical protein